MTSDKDEDISESEDVRRLEGHLEMGRAEIRLLESRLEETNSFLAAVSDGLRKSEEVLASLTAQTAGLPAMRQELRQVKIHFGKSSAQQGIVQEDAEKPKAPRRVDLDREREGRAALSKRLEMMDSLVDQYESRLQAFESSTRHLGREYAGLRKGHEEIGQEFHRLRDRVEGGLESAKRVEHEQESLAEALGALRSRLGEASSDVQVAQEVLRRVEGRVDSMERQLPKLEEIRELQEASRFEWERISERLTRVEDSVAETTSRTREFGGLLMEFQRRSQTEAADVASLLEEARGYRQEVTEHLRQLSLLMQRQRRRRVQTLGQEIKEIKQGDLDADAE